MNNRRSVVQRVAARLISHAAQTLPVERADWATAMGNEFQYISGSYAPLIWAVGCVLASYAERIRVMNGNNPRISLWVLVLEMLCCFTPLTLRKHAGKCVSQRDGLPR
jgi:hypothetical protein